MHGDGARQWGLLLSEPLVFGVGAGPSSRRGSATVPAALACGTDLHGLNKTLLTLERIMNYVHGLFLSVRGVGTMVRAVVEEAATLASLALFLGMIAIWAQVIAAL